MRPTLKSISFLAAFAIVLGACSTKVKVSFEQKKGDATRYSYEHDEKTLTVPNAAGGQPFAANLSLKGALELRHYGDSPEGRVTGLKFLNLKKLVFSFNGNAINPDELKRQIEGREAFLLFGPKNEIKAIYFEKNAPIVFKQFTMSVASELDVRVHQGASSWKARESEPRGTAETEYRVLSDGRDSYEIEKRKLPYETSPLLEETSTQSSDIKYSIQLGKDGKLKSINGSGRAEIMNAGRKILDLEKSVRLEAKEEVSFDPTLLKSGAIKTLEEVTPGSPIFDPELKKRLLRERASGLTPQSLENWIQNFEKTASNSQETNSMFWRATAFVELHPQLGQRLVTLFPRLNEEKGNLALNILAGAGGPEAQAAMRKILSSTQARKSKRYPILIQNFSFIENIPAPETLQFLKNEGSPQAGNSYGTMIWRLAQAGKTREAKEANGYLLKRLEKATSIPEKAEWIGAMGNAGLEDNIPKLRELAHSDEPTIRAEACMALRKTQTEDARQTLVLMVTDAERSVQRAAIQTLMQFKIQESDLKVFEKALKQKSVFDVNFYDLTSLLQKNRKTFPSLTKKCLKRMLDYKLQDPDLEARIRGLIAE